MSYADAKGRDTATLLEAESFNPSIGDLNVLIKRLAEKLLPILGQQIQLGLFCTSGVFPVAMQPNRIEEILSRFFAQAKEEMQTGGIVVIQTERQKVPGDRYSTSNGGTDSQVVLNFRYTIRGMEEETARSSAGFQSRCTRLGAMAEAVGCVAEEGRGYLSFDCTSRESAIRLHLPVANQIGLTDKTARI